MYNNTMVYIEDILVDLVNNYEDKVVILSRDSLIFNSFYNIHIRGDSLTKSQGNLLIKLLTRYQDAFLSVGFDYTNNIKEPVWKSKFRSIDFTRKVSIELDENKIPWVYVKFPYQLKESFEKEVTVGNSLFDPTSKSRKFHIYNCNLLQINEFAEKNGFEIEESFLQAMADFEEIISQQENIIPSCSIVDNKVFLHNTTQEVLEWWETNRYNNINDDLMLAKSMGFVLNTLPTTLVEKIAANDGTDFWIESPRTFLSFAKDLTGKIVLILDRAHNNFNWLKEFTKVAEEVGFVSDEIKVCFRADKDQNQELNQWIKDSGYGGKVDTGKILIFNHKPAKWVFKNINDVRILATNNLYPPTDSVTKDWFANHPCLIYIGEIKPSKTKDRKIAKL
jgi:hypothetical protein